MKDQQTDSKRDMLITGSIVKLMFKLSIPAIIGMLVIGLYSFVDAIFLGQWVGKNAIGAISVSYPLTLLNNGIAVLVGIGSASVLSRAIGSEDKETVDKIMGNLFMMVLILSVITTVIGTVCTKWLLSFSKVEGEILSYSIRYLKIIFIGSFFVNFAQAANMVIRGEGKMMAAMGIMAAGAILNIILDPIFIKVLDYGVEGAAIATVISQVLQAVATLVYFIKFSPKVRFHGLKLDFKLIPGIAGVGLSATLMQVMSLVQQTVVYASFSRYGGEEKVILMGALMRYIMLAFIPLWGMSQGFQPLAGTNYGAGELQRVKQATKVFAVSSAIMGVLFWIPIIFFTRSILGWFITDSAIIANGLADVRIALLVFPVAGPFITFVTLFQAVGDAKKAGLLVMMRQAFLFIPLVYIMPLIGNLRATGVFATFSVTDTLVFVLAIILVTGLFKSFKAVKTKEAEKSGEGKPAEG